jgi:hypothetical protein
MILPVAFLAYDHQTGEGRVIFPPCSVFLLLPGKCSTAQNGRGPDAS